MNMVLAKRVGGPVSYFIGSNSEVLCEYFLPLMGNEYESVASILIREAKYFGLDHNKLDAAKERIRAGEEKIIDLGPPQVIVFE